MIEFGRKAFSTAINQTMGLASIRRSCIRNMVPWQVRIGLVLTTPERNTLEEHTERER